MRQLIKGLILVFFIFLQSLSYASLDQSLWYEKKNNDVILNVELYLTSSCPHCHKAEQFFDQIQTEFQWIHVKKFFINKNKSDLKQFANRLETLDSINYAVPSIFFCGARWVGFDNHIISGKPILESLKYCHSQLLADGFLNTHTVQSLREQGGVTQFQNQQRAQDGGFYYVATIAIMDAMNQCTLYGLMVFLGLLLLAQSSRLQQFLIGTMSILGVVIMKGTQITQTNIYYLFESHVRWPSAVLGVVLLYYLFKNRMGIESKKTRLVLLFLALITAGCIQIQQQHCPLNFSLIYKQWLQGQDILYFQTILYNIIYLVFLSLTMMFFLGLLLIFFNLEKISKHGVYLFTTGWLSLFFISVLLIIYPAWFSSFIISWVLLVVSCLIPWFFFRLKRPYETK